MKVKILVTDFGDLELFKIGDVAIVKEQYRNSKLCTLPKSYQGTKLSYEFLNNEIEVIH